MRRRRPISERLALHGLDPRVTSILRVGGGSGGGGGGGGGDGPSPTISHLIYVMKGGNDSTGDGTDEQPYLTVGRALAVAKTFVGLSQAAMVLVLVAPGMYVENVAIPPFVIVSAMDESGADVLIGAGSGPAITLDSVAWATSTSGYAGVVNILTNYLVGDLSGPINIDFTGVTSPGSFLVAGIGVAGSLTVTGDSVGGGFVFVTSEAFIDEDITLTGVIMSMLGGSALFGTLTFASSATQASGGFVSDCSVISEFSAGSVVLDATAGQNVAVIVDATNVDGSLTLKDGGGGVTNYTASVGGIPGQIIRTGGAAAPKLTRYASTQLPDSTFTVYVNKSGDDTDGNGTEGAPFLTIGKALAVAAPLVAATQNVDVIVQQGEYTEDIVLPPGVNLLGVPSTPEFWPLLSGNVTGATAATWNASAFPYSTIAALLITGNVTIDFTGVTSEPTFQFGAWASGNLTVIGDPTNTFLQQPSFETTTGAFIIGNLTVSDVGFELNKTRVLSNVSFTSTNTGNVPMLGAFLHSTLAEDSPATVTLTSSDGAPLGVTSYESPIAASASLILDGTGVTFSGTIGSIPASVTRSSGAAAPETIPVYAAAFGPIVPPALPAVPITYASGSITGLGNAVASTSDKGAITVLSIAGGSNREFVTPDAVELLTIAGGGGTAAADYALPAEFCGRVYVDVVGIGNTGTDGFYEGATATVRVDAGGNAAFVTQVAGSTNPLVNPNLDHASDATFNSGGGVPSAIALACIGGDFVVTVQNNGVGANDFVVYLYTKGFAS